MNKSLIIKIADIINKFEKNGLYEHADRVNSIFTKFAKNQTPEQIAQQRIIDMQQRIQTPLQQQPNTQTDPLENVFKRNSPEKYKNLAKEKQQEFLNKGYPFPEMYALQSVSEAMRKNQETAYYHNTLIQEIKKELPSTPQNQMMNYYRPANSTSQMDPFFAQYYKELQQKKLEQQQEKMQQQQQSK